MASTQVINTNTINTTATTTTASSSNTTNIAQREQDAVYNKVKQASSFYKDYKAGTATIDIPTTNESINTQVDKSLKNIEKFQNSTRGKELGAKNTVVIEDIKEMLRDEKLILDAKNNDEQLQKAAKSGFTLVQDVAKNPAIRELLLRWKGELVTAAKTGNWKETLKAGGDVFAKMREAEAFLELIVEMNSLIKSLSTKQDRAERAKIFQQMGDTLRILSSSKLWSQMLANRSVPDHVKVDAKNAVNGIDKEHVNAFMRDAQALLQAVVGPDVDLGPFVRASAAAYDSLALNKSFVDLVSEFQTLLQEVNNSEASLDPTTSQLDNIVDRMEFEVTLAKNNVEFRTAKEEGKKILEKLKADPVNLKVYNDFRKLLKDADGDFLGAFRTFLIPIIKEHISNIPVQMLNSSARVMGSQIDFQVANLKLNANDFIPENFRFKVEYEMEGKGHNFTVDHQKMVIHVEINNIQLSFDNVQWSYTRHSTPKMEDKGKVRFNTLRNGISLKLVVEVYPNRTKDIFVVKTARCDIDKFNIHVTESKHNTMYHMLFGMSAGKVKKEVRKAIELKLRELGQQAEAKMIQIVKDGKEKVTQNVDKVKSNLNQKKEAKLQKKAEKKAAREAKATAAAAALTAATSVAPADPAPVPLLPIDEPVKTTTTTAVEVEVEVMGAETVVTEIVAVEKKVEDVATSSVQPESAGVSAM